MKFFNTTGPVRPEVHYCLPLETRLDENELRTLVEQQKYFVLHAPRQTGKTSTVLNFVRQLNEENVYTSLYVNVEGAQTARSDYVKGMYTILEIFLNSLEDQLPAEKEIINYISKKIETQMFSGESLKSMLQYWAKNSTKSIVLFIDEIDSLVGDTLISVLRQLRSGYSQGPKSFPQSVCLVGVRDVRDYQIWSEVEHQMILGGSAFNIKAKSLRLSDFTKNEVAQLYLQHTKETGQQFTDDAIAYAFEITQGQPWLVNALAYEACFEMVIDRSKTITKEVLETAKETLIKRQDTHLDVLIDRLQEPRVRAIIDQIISGGWQQQDFPKDDLQYVQDLGLISQEGIKIANPIYQEIIPRALAYTTQRTIIQNAFWYTRPDGSLDMHKMLMAFTEFYRENAAVWLEKFAYKEAGPHLLTMAFLQRVINGGGKIHREYALGTDRVDLLILWKTQRIVIELKIWRSTKKTVDEGLEQTANYMDISNATEGHLIIFDRRQKNWDEKIYTRQEIVGNKVITVWGM